MRPAGFRGAFESVAEAVELAAALPDSTSAQVQNDTVTSESAKREVEVTP